MTIETRLPAQQSQESVGRVDLAEAREDLLHHEVVGRRVDVRDRVPREGHVVAALVRAARRSVDAAARRNASEHDAGDLPTAKLQVELRAVERVGLPLRDENVAW